MANYNLAEIGAHLLYNCGFKKWFLFLFKSVEGFSFVQSAVSEKSFELFEGIFKQLPSAQRVNLNEPPRSSKTTLILYFFVFCVLRGQCNFIYTTFSGQLLREAKDRIKKIISSEIFLQMYGDNPFEEVEEENKFFDDIFAKNFEQVGQKFLATKIILGKSTIYLTPLGSTTGLGAGVKGALGYSGGVFMDDINKVTDTLLNKKLNEKIKEYYSTNILTRLNNEKCNIINVQQRISRNDMTEFLEKTYDFLTIKIPLIDDETGICNLPNEYNERRIEELKRDFATYMAQYQQEPLDDGVIAFDGQMFDFDLLQQSAQKSIPFFSFDEYSCFGVDPKREGTDNFAIVYRKGKYSTVIFNDKRTFDTQTAVDVIVKFFNKYQPTEICIDSGKGEGIIDLLRASNYPVKEIKFGSESHRNDCYNKRAAMYADVLDWIVAGGKIDNNAELIEDLSSQEYIRDNDNRIKLADKDRIKKRIGRSPGLSDALALTFGNRQNSFHNKQKNKFKINQIKTGADYEI